MSKLHDTLPRSTHSSSSYWCTVLSTFHSTSITHRHLNEKAEKNSLWKRKMRPWITKLKIESITTLGAFRTHIRQRTKAERTNIESSFSSIFPSRAIWDHAWGHTDFVISQDSFRRETDNDKTLINDPVGQYYYQFNCMTHWWGWHSINTSTLLQSHRARVMTPHVTKPAHGHIVHVS